MKKKKNKRFFPRYASLLFSFNGDSNSNKIDLQTLHAYQNNSKYGHFLCIQRVL